MRQVFLIWIFLFHDSLVTSRECSRSLSRIVRQIIKEEFLTKLEQKSMKFRDNCPLNPLYDQYRIQEQHKYQAHNLNYRCKYCSKEFKNEFYLDRHLDNKHSDQLFPNATICLADYCPIFGCSFKSRSSVDSPFHKLVYCRNEEVEKYTHQCEALARSCFDRNDELYQYFLSKICQALHCENGVLKGIYHEEETLDWSTALFIVIRWIGSILMIALLIAYVGGSKLFQRWRSAPSTTSQNIFEEKRTRYRHNTGEGGKGWFASVDRLLKSLFVSNKKKS